MPPMLSWLTFVWASFSLSAAIAADVLVVCPVECRAALRPWLLHRQQQGHTIELLGSQGSAAEIQAVIRERAKREPVRFVMLVGDAAPFPEVQGAVSGAVTPAERVTAKINVLFGSQPHICTDNGYGDLDGDGVPDLAVGRLTADSPADLAQMVQKILDYELRASHGAWRQKIHFIGGLGGFGPVIDGAMEQWARRLITEGVPAAFTTTMTYGSWQSPYCPAPQDFRAATLDRLNEGGLFWVYMGHGDIRNVDWIRVPGGGHPILTCDDMPRLKNRHSPPIALFLSCYSGAFDASKDCLGEEMLRAAGGPVAVVCGSRVTMPYAMAVLGNELMQECFQARRETVGELLLHAKRNMVLKERSDDFSRGLDAVAAALNPKSDDLAAERTEHLSLFNLLGDPLLRLPHPQAVKLQVPAEVEAGERLEFSGTCEVEGRCTCELVVRRDRLTFKPPAREEYLETATARQEHALVYRQANDQRLVTAQAEVVDGKFCCSLVVPADAHGPCHVRVFVEGTEAFALGAADTKVRRVPRTARKR